MIYTTPTAAEVVKDLQALKAQAPQLVANYKQVTEEDIAAGVYTESEIKKIRGAY